MKAEGASGRRRRLAVAVLLAAVAAASLWRGREAFTGAATSPEALFAARRSGTWIEASGVVDRLLADDRTGAPHQRFVLRLPSGHTLLVSHNLALAPYVPASPGEALAVRGQYEWNERGGVVHWTHHDPRGELPGGWIRRHGVDYR